LDIGRVMRLTVFKAHFSCVLTGTVVSSVARVCSHTGVRATDDNSG
jgi:hypothetical protein